MAIHGLAMVSIVRARFEGDDKDALRRRSTSMAAAVFSKSGSGSFTISSAVPRLTFVELFIAAKTVSVGSWMGTAKERQQHYP